MTRKETIAAITERLATAPDEIVQSVAKLLDAAAGEESILPRPLTPRELALIEQSKADFRNGDTLSPDELEAFLDAAADNRARMRTKK